LVGLSSSTSRAPEHPIPSRLVRYLPWSNWADSITAVLDALGSREAAVLAPAGALPTSALFAATRPSRTTALVVLEGYADQWWNALLGSIPRK
jgi:pimeloyl-ACP methyl ester carboxylesterase